MSTKEHCHGCGKLWSEESPDCIFNYHKKPEIKCHKCICYRFTNLPKNIRDYCNCECHWEK